MKLNLKRLGLLAGRAARVFAARAGLTPQRVDLMHLAREFDLSQRQLAERLCVSTPVVSRMLAALERRGLVYRVEDPRDRRNKFTRLTRDGLDAVGQCCPAADSRGAQATGEGIWLAAWRIKLARLGLRVDSILRARAPRDFADLADWNRRYAPEATVVRTRAPNTPTRDPELEAMIAALHVDVDAWFRGEWRPLPT